ncbi:hypothetical protein EDC32_102598 [Laceyella sacchari]|uniref:hypothetical protein n=1 Tax=Laceyella sacchari TaxID=37482 RepID=UPI001045B228|nr:hypothetical protein [Laceyella sacchari]TCW39349.1 hypothetical protein EDC32_102598 [Laceyella sacchari]
MQRAEVILSLLSQKAKEQPHFRFRRLYRNLFNPDFYRYALTQVQETSGTEADLAPHGQAYIAMIEKMIHQLRTETYRFAPDDFGKVDEPGRQPKWEDRLLRGAVIQLISAIFEPHFWHGSHGVYPMPTIEGALRAIREAIGVDWLVGGALPVHWNPNQQALLLELLRERLEDGRLLELVRRMLNADRWQMTERTEPIVVHADEERLLFPCQLLFHALDRCMRRYVQVASSPIDMHYIRWNRYLFVGVKGSKRMAQTLRDHLHDCLENELGFESFTPLTLVHVQDKHRVRFGPYELAPDCREPGRLTPLVPHVSIQELTRPFRREGKPVRHPGRLHLSVPELVSLYAGEMKELYQTYRYAADVRAKLGKFRYYHYGSLLKTIASKEKISVKQVLRKYGSRKSGSKQTLAVKGEMGWISYFNEPLSQCSLIYEERLRDNWRAGYIERCTSGSEGG